MPALQKPDFRCKRSLTFDEMLSGINKQFSRSDKKVDIDEIWRILESYQSNAQDWSKFAFYDEHRYKRNLVTDHEKYNVMILCWAPNVRSSIHDHSDAHCFMKILDNSLVESRFAWPDEQKSISARQELKVCTKCNGNHGNMDDEDKNHSTHNGMKLISKSNLESNDVLYINDKVGLHCIENRNPTKTAASLHIYIPPFRKCKTFDEKTGRSRECTLTFYSKRGEIVSEENEHDLN